MKKIGTAMFLIIVLLFGCNSQIEFEDGSLIHSEQTSSDEHSFGDRIVEIAENADEYEELWDYFNFNENRSEVDFEVTSLIFLQTSENSCPKEIEKFEIDNDEANLVVETIQRESNCDDIGLERTFVLEINKEKFGKVEKIHFEGERFSLDD